MLYLCMLYIYILNVSITAFPANEACGAAKDLPEYQKVWITSKILSHDPSNHKVIGERSMALFETCSQYSFFYQFFPRLHARVIEREYTKNSFYSWKSEND